MSKIVVLYLNMGHYSSNNFQKSTDLLLSAMSMLCFKAVAQIVYEETCEQGMCKACMDRQKDEGKDR